MRTMHLFAGAGGGLLADLILGHTPIIAVEWDAYCCQVLRERAADGWFPELRVWEGDVRLFYPSEYAGKVDCIHAGFPCQDISVAGKQAGVGEETRSGLYREVLRIAGVVRPKYLFLENVAAIVSNGLGTVIADLAKIGYDTEWLCLRASDCGAKHHRDRWWGLAYAVSGSDQSDKYAPGIQNSIESKNRKARHARMPSGASNDTEVLADPCNQRLQGRKTPANDGEYWQEPRNEQFARRGWGALWHESEPNLGRVANGVAYRVHRIKALGNGQVPLQAAAAWKLLGGK